MNIHEHQAKQILKKYGVVVPKGVFAFTVDELIEKVKSLKTEKFVLKAQIHAGGRGKAGGVKILNNINELTEAIAEQPVYTWAEKIKSFDFPKSVTLMSFNLNFAYLIFPYWLTEIVVKEVSKN